jgi:hypothetical protein
MAANPEDFPRYALNTLTKRAIAPLPPPAKKFADLAFAWLMFAAQIEATRRKGGPE